MWVQRFIILCSSLLIVLVASYISQLTIKVEGLYTCCMLLYVLVYVLLKASVISVTIGACRPGPARAGLIILFVLLISFIENQIK